MIDRTASAEPSYDVSLSFAGEQRDYAREVADLLHDAGVRVFFDEYATVDLWGEDTYTHLDEVYNYRSRYCLLFASADFARRVWTNHERISAQAKAIRSATAYILPVRFDDTKIPGLRETIGYVDARATSPAGVAQLLLKKLALSALETVNGTILVLATDDPALDLDRILDTSLSRCRVEVPADLRSRTGSRSTTVIPVSERTTAQVMSALVPAIESVAELQLARSPGAKLRIGVHEAEVPRAHGGRCLDVTATEASVDAAVVGETLAAAPAAYCVVVASQRVHDNVLRHGRGGAGESSYRQVTQPDGSALFLRVPGYPKPPAPGRRAPEAPVKHTTNTLIGPNSVGQIGDQYYGNTHG